MQGSVTARFLEGEHQVGGKRAKDSVDGILFGCSEGVEKRRTQMKELGCQWFGLSR
jgi:hypothetical protein